MALFGSDEKKEAEEQSIAEERERIESMPLTALAEEILVKVWGRGGPADAYEKSDTAIAFHEIEKLYGPELSISNVNVFGSDSEPMIGITELLEEALQMLEHAKLVVFRVSGGDIVKVQYRPTRAGLKAMDAGNARSLLDGSPG